jgi:hypothetical protein
MSEQTRRTAAIVAYAVLGAVLVATRAIGLGRSYWHDEIVTVRDFVRVGPDAILAGDRLNHELYSLVTWAVEPVLGDGEIVTRAWSVVPFILGIALVTAWLHVRIMPLAGVLFLALATASPLLLDVSRQARGYGLGVLAMSVLLVSALEATRTRRTTTIVAFCLAGVLGTLTLANFGPAFLATAAVLITQRELRRRLGVGLVVSIAGIAAFYAPNLDVLSSSSDQEYGARIDVLRAVTGPFDQLLLPGLLKIDGEPPTTTLLGLPFVLLAAVLVAASPLLHSRTTALTMSASVVVTFLTLWLTETRSVPRFITFLLVPMLMLLASGIAAILSNPKRMPLRATLALVGLAVVLGAAVSEGLGVMRYPREAHRDAVRLVEDEPGSIPLYAFMPQPRDLGFYASQRIRALRSTSSAGSLCARREPIALVIQPWRVAAFDPPCLDRPGVRHETFEQYARGGRIDVWFIPPAS